MTELNPQQVMSMTDIADYAQHSIAVVSNWRIRYDSFPVSVQRQNNERPRFDRAEVIEWLRVNDKMRGATGSRPRRLLNQVARTLGRSLAIDFYTAVMIVVRSAAGMPTSDIRIEAQAATLDPAIQEFVKVDGWRTLPNDVIDDVIEWAKVSSIEDLDELAEATLKSDNLAARSKTPPAIVDLLVALAGTGAKHALDLASGDGSLLAAVVSRGAAATGHGVDIEGAAILRARRRAYLEQLEAVTYAQRDTLGTDTRLTLNDLVFVDPPLGPLSSAEAKLLDSQDWSFGQPMSSRPEWAWLQKAVAHLSERGVAFVVTDANALSSQDKAASEIRREMLRRGSVRAIITLPERLRSETDTPQAIWVLVQPDRPDRRSTVLLIDASGDDLIAEPGSKRFSSDFSRSVVPEIALAYHAWVKDKTADLNPRAAVAVPVLDLLGKSTSILPKRWIDDPFDSASGKDLAHTAQRHYEQASLTLAKVGRKLPPVLVGAVSDRVGVVSLQQLVARAAIKITPGRVAEPSNSGSVSGLPILTSETLIGLENSADIMASVTFGSSAGAQIVPGDIVVYLENGVVNARVWQKKGWMLGRFLQSITVKDLNIDPVYLAAAIAHPSNRRFLVASKVRTQFDLTEFEVRLPSADAQRNFARVSTQLEERRDGALAALRDLNEARASFATAIASGRTEVI